MRHPRNDALFHGRSREIGAIRSALDSPEAAILRVEGMRGVGKSALVDRALEGMGAVRLTVPSLPEPHQRAAIARALEPAGATGEPPDWAGLFHRAAERARPGRPPFVLALDDAHRLGASRARWERALAQALARARTDGRPFHVILVGPPSGDLPEALAPFEGDTVPVPPLPLRAAAPMLPGRTARDKIRAYGVFGGIPRVLRALDRDVTLETNVRRTLVDDDGPLADAPGVWLERDLQTPARYNAILAALAWGEADWSSIHAQVPDLTTSGQLAPYLTRLEQLGLIEVRRSLDAPSTARARRYRIVDPFLAFWYRMRLAPLTGSTASTPPRTPPAPSAPVATAATTVAATAHPPDGPEGLPALRRKIDDHVESVFADICRQHMDHDARSTLGANARELGGLWGQGYDIPVAGILTSGAAFYGACAWRLPPRGEDPLATLDEAARETRYGFGREHRLRLFFTGADAPRWLERLAVRLNQCILLGPEALTG